MSELATITVATQPETPPPPSRGFKQRIFQGLLARIRFAQRRPGRAASIACLFLLVVAVLAVSGIWIWFEYHLQAAQTALDAGHNAVAIAHLKKCQRIRPKQRDVLLLSARAARRVGSWEEADSMLTEYWRQYGDEEPLIFERILYRASRGDIEGTGEAIRARIVKGGPQARFAREALVTGFTYRFRWIEAGAVLDAWLAETPNDTLALIQHGKYLEQQNAFEEAMNAFRKVIELDPDQLEARLRLATILLSRRYGEEAAAELEVLRKNLPDNPEIQVLWARSLSLLGRTEESRTVIAACLESFPDYPPAMLEQGNNALLDGDEETAEKHLARAVRLDPGNSQIRNKYALVLSRNSKPAKAAEEYAKARELEADAERITQIIRGPFQDNPNNPAIHHEIGAIALRSGLVDEALRWFNSALQVDPNHLPTHQILANLYRELDQPALAAKYHATAQKLSQQQQRKN